MPIKSTSISCPEVSPRSANPQQDPANLIAWSRKATSFFRNPVAGRKAQNLVYTASDDKFVLTGGPPSIFDAEQGKITGDSLTFFRSDDRALVEGK